MSMRFQHAIVRVVSVNYFQLRTTGPKSTRENSDFIGMNWGGLLALPGGIALLTGCSEVIRRVATGGARFYSCKTPLSLATVCSQHSISARARQRISSMLQLAAAR